MATKKPKADDLFDLARDMIDAAADRNTLYDRIEDLYDQSRNAEARDQDADGGAILVQMPYATNTIDLVVDLAAQMELTLEVPAASESAAAKKEADECEAWLRAWLSQNERLQNRNFMQDAAWHGAMRSLVVMRCLYLDKAISDKRKGEDDDDDDKSEGELELTGLPVLLQVRDPRYLYYQEAADGIECVVEAWTRPASEIRLKYPGVLDDDMDDTADVDWIEYWDDTYRCYWADGKAIKTKGLGEVVPHGYGCLPYSFGFARATPRAAPGKRFRPLLAASESLLKLIDVHYSIAATASHDAVVSAWGVFSDAYGEATQKDVDLNPGQINYFAANDKVEPLQRSPLPSDFYQTLRNLELAYQQGTFPFQMYGQPGGATSGYAVNLLQQSGRRPLIPIWDAIERAYEGALVNCVTICKEKVAPLVGDKIPLKVLMSSGETSGKRRVKRALRLDTAKFGSDFDIEVSLSDPMPADEAQNLRMALESTKGGLLSKETALTKWKLAPDPMNEMDRIATERVFESIAPIYGVKLARERGYIPQDIEAPPGFTAVNGQLVPNALLPKPQPEPPNRPSGEVMTPGQPGGPAGVNPAEMQMMSAKSVPPDLAQFAGAPPPQPIPGMEGM